MAKANSVEQQKILRVFKLINLLRGNIGKTVHKLADLLQTDTRTVYRYFKLLESLGFEIEKKYGKFKIIDRVEAPDKFAFGTFNDEEIDFMQEIFSKHGKKHLLKDAILQKITIRSDFNQSIHKLFNANLGIFVDLLASAIKQENQVILADYYSLSSDSVSDRLVEPVAFNKNFDSVFAFEVESKEMKQFKIERIGEVLLTSKSFVYQQLHERLEQGLFGFTGKNQFEVVLKLSKKAYQLMMEEFPDAKPFTYTKNRNQYYFEGKIPQLPGLARFILGLPGEVKIIEGEELKQYIQDQLAKVTYF
ncbi:helix-turn-helix transcriptional regulator [Mongoliitalea daihaiensis]|uniref:helix-turn-helix transcriptional regulator n=1 Tax=Mongoliitalea daihaiensis TaxID=2782006 RepID=UPI001F41B518|nr:WYL domain-containing protein [Mongoliitalea daihaiensis]UJP64273.1 WYL domain-containing protein [Mongoliitalea daihaiensis]